MFGVDYASAGPSVRSLKGAGVGFVCRYLSTPGNRKNLSKLEAAKLRDADIHIVTVFETTAQRALAGSAAGRRDARSARQQLAACGAPDNAPVYFAVDFDCQPSQLDTALAYLAGAASVLGTARTGVYGGYRVVKAALDAGTVALAWQTYAWSGGKWDPRAHLQQYRNSQVVGGVEVDFNRAAAVFFGQWQWPPAPKPSPPPKPAPVPAPIPASAPAPDAVVITGPKGGLIARRTAAAAAKLVPRLVKRFGKISVRKAR